MRTTTKHTHYFLKNLKRVNRNEGICPSNTKPGSSSLTVNLKQKLNEIFKIFGCEYLIMIDNR